MMRWRPLESLQLSRLAKLWNESFEDYIIPIELSEEQLQQRINTLHLSPTSSFIAEVEDTEAGIVLYGEEIFHGKSTAWIGGMGVIKPMRQHGVGKAMIEKTIDMARVDGIDQLHLEVIKENVKAEKLYKKSGFDYLHEVTVGSLAIDKHFLNTMNVQLVSSEITEEHIGLEPEKTVWQNRLNRKLQLQNIVINGENKGYVYWHEQTGVLRQLELIEPNDMLFSSVFAKLHENSGQNHLKISNVNVEHPLYDFLLNHHYVEELRQIHMCYFFKK